MSPPPALPLGLLFASPLALLALGTVPLIVLLHALSRRRQRRVVSSLLFWDAALRERKSLARLRRILGSAELLLQCLAAALLSAALAQPILSRAGLPGGGAVVVVLDETASMEAREGGRTRFDEARSRALSLVSSLPRGRSMCVVAAARFPRLVVPFTADRGLLTRSLRAESATDEPGELRDSLAFALGLRDARRGDTLAVITDGAFDSLGPLDGGEPWLRLIRVGEGSRNAAVTALALRRTAVEERGYELFAEARNFSPAPMSFPFTVTAGDSVLLSMDLTLAAGETRDITVPYTGPLPAGKGVRVTAAISPGDDLPADDRAYAVLSPSRAVSAAVSGPPDLFLDRGLGALPNVTVRRAAPGSPEPGVGSDEGADVTVYDRVDPPPLEKGNFILIAAVPPNLPLRAAGVLASPRVTAWQRSSPLLASVEAGSLSVRHALRIEGRGFTTLVRSQDAPLILTCEREELKILIIAFPLESSDLPLRPAFPLLLANAMEWFFPGWLSAEADLTRAGDPRALPAPPGAPVDVRGPDGSRWHLAAGAPFSHTAKAGFYAVTQAGRSFDFAVSIASPEESNITPRYRPAGAGPGGGPGAGDASGVSLQPVWMAAAAAALALVMAELLLTIRSRGITGLSPARRRGFLLLRAAAVLLLSLSLAGLSLSWGRGGVSLVLLLDQSASVGDASRRRAAGTFNRLRSRLAAGDTALLVRFAGSAEEEELRAGQAVDPEGGGQLPRDSTDIAGALEFALAQLPGSGARRILLASDGNENRGRAAEAAALARSFGVPVSTVPLSPEAGGVDAAVEDIAVPARVRAGEPHQVTVLLRSRTRTAARVSLFRDGEPVGVREETLPAGQSSVTITGLFTDGGLHGYEALVEAAGDVSPFNDRLKRFVDVAGSPAVLYVSRRGERSPALLSALRGQGIRTEEAMPASLPGTLLGLTPFDGIILDDVPANSLSYEKMGLIEQYVRDAGGGLVMIGGPNSFGAGGYYKTPVERALPVDMDVRAQVQVPRLSLVILCDTSGSMGAPAAPEQTKLDVVKSAALSAVELLNPFDRVGLLAFNADWQWAVGLTEAGNRELIGRELATLTSGGGTILLPALQEARRALAASPSALKHLILISDGLSQPADFRRELSAMARDGITVSTVAVGEDADADLLERIARWGGGRFYAANDAASVPRIFMAETMLVSRGLMIERRFLPQPFSAGEALRGIPLQGMPPLDGFVLTFLKNGAEKSLGALYGSPLLATWRYGLGRSAAFTSDLTGRWGSAWLGWDQFPRFAAQLVRWVQRPSSSGTLHPAIRFIAGTGTLSVDAWDELGGFVNGLRITGVVLDPGGGRSEVPLPQRAPGLYEGSFPAERAGDYTVTLSAAGPGSPGPLTVGASIPYPEEYRESGVNVKLLETVARESGGKLLSLSDLEGAAGDTLVRREPGQPSHRLPLWPLFLGAGLLAFFLDIAARRLMVPESLRARLGALFGFPGRGRRRGKSYGPEELAGMVAAAREAERRRLRERISATAADGRIDPELAAYLYIARLKGRSREEKERR